MYNDNQDRIDAYLLGRMDNNDRIQFEKDLDADEMLLKEYISTKAIAGAVTDRREKLNMMARWDKEEKLSKQLASRKTRIRRLCVGLGATACVAVAFFAARPLFMTTSNPGYNFVMPNFGNNEYYRGGNNSIEYLDSLINSGDYENALAKVDSLIFQYQNELKRFDSMGSLSEKDEYSMELCQDELQDLEWRRANLLLALDKMNDARECLKGIVAKGGIYEAQADSLLNILP